MATHQTQLGGFKNPRIKVPSQEYVSGDAGISTFKLTR